MTLHTPTLSESALRTIQDGLDRLASRPEYGDRLLAQADTARLAVSLPHDVYTLGLEAIAEGRGLDAAEPVGRRCLVMEDERPVAAAELRDQGAEGEGELTTTEGPFTEATARTVQEVEGWPEVAEGEYDLRLLRVPALYLMALWLKDRDGSADLLVPLDPAPSGLESGARYEEGELLDRLQRRARERLEFEQEEPGDA
jgi:hypothetical protein